jgi:hypothetical protein
MNPNGVVHLNSNQKRLDLNRGSQQRKNYNRDKKTLPRRNHLLARSEITSLYSQPKREEPYATKAPEGTSWRKQLIQRSAPVSVKESFELGKSSHKKLVCRFLSWCFPPRGFASPLQRLLYLSMEGPKPKARSRVLFR